MDLLRIIIAILLPPLGVFLQVGIGKQFWINILSIFPFSENSGSSFILRREIYGSIFVPRVAQRCA
jgi:hypothetical protein